MATIRAAWKRTIRVREYESETLELMVEKNVLDADDASHVAAAAQLDRDLALAGDALVAERLEVRMTTPEPKAGAPRARAGSPSLPMRSPAQPLAPDPLV